MTAEGRTASTLTGPRRCLWCGHRCHGETCQYCKDLARAERAVWILPKGDGLPKIGDELRAAVKRP